jgi:preprotein translocase subunit SecD
MRRPLKMVAFFACVAGCARESTSSTAARPLIDLRLVSADSAASTQRFLYHGEVLFLEGESIVSDDDFVEVDVFEADEPLTPSALRLRYELTPEGARRLRTATAASIGRRIAILVDGQVTVAAVIRDALGWRGVAQLGFRGEEAERITRLIRDRWPSSDAAGP